MDQFDPESSVRLSEIHPEMTDEEMGALNEYRAVSKFKRIQGARLGIAICEYSKKCAAKMIRSECKQFKLNGKWNVFPIRLGKMSLSDTVALEGNLVAEPTASILPAQLSGRNVYP